MAFDEDLFKQFREKDQPILRFFYFFQPTLTLGRLEARRLDLSKLKYPHEIRPTGGRAVLHGKDDLCYSIIAPKKDSLVGGDLLESYRKIGKLLAGGIQTLGRETVLTSSKHRGLNDPHCFSAPSQSELIFKGKKVAGGAQARREDVFLQQGVLLLSVSGDWTKAFPGAQPENMIGLNDDPNLKVVDREQLEGALGNAFESAGVRFEKPLTSPAPSLKL